MANNLHVLIIPSWFPTPEFPLTGSFFLEHAHSVALQGIKVGVIYPECRRLKSILKRPWKNHFQIEWMDMDERVPLLGWRGWNPYLSNFRGKCFIHMAQVLAQKYVSRYGKPDVIHAQSSLWGGMAAQRISNELKCSFVITEHSTTFMSGQIRPEWKSDLRLMLEAADGVSAVSKPFAKVLNNYIPNREITVIPNGVDTDFFYPLMEKRDADGVFRFFSVANLISRKGMDVLINAFTEVFGGDLSVHLDIGGMGVEFPRLKTLVSRLHMEDQVRFLGTLTREGVRNAMQKSHVFVLASLAETFGVVFIEALACGLVVVGTQCGGPEDIIRPEVGFLAPPGDATALGLAMKKAKMLVSTERSEIVRSYVIDHFKASVVAARYIQFYEKAMNSVEL